MEIWCSRNGLRLPDIQVTLLPGGMCRWVTTAPGRLAVTQEWPRERLERFYGPLDGNGHLPGARNPDGAGVGSVLDLPGARLHPKSGGVFAGTEEKPHETDVPGRR